MFDMEDVVEGASNGGKHRSLDLSGALATTWCEDPVHRRLSELKKRPSPRSRLPRSHALDTANTFGHDRSLIVSQTTDWSWLGVVKRAPAVGRRRGVSFLCRTYARSCMPRRSPSQTSLVAAGLGDRPAWVHICCRRMRVDQRSYVSVRHRDVCAAIEKLTFSAGTMRVSCNWPQVFNWPPSAFCHLGAVSD